MPCLGFVRKDNVTYKVLPQKRIFTLLNLSSLCSCRVTAKNNNQCNRIPHPHPAAEGQGIPYATLEEIPIPDPQESPPPYPQGTSPQGIPPPYPQELSPSGLQGIPPPDLQGMATSDPQGTPAPSPPKGFSIFSLQKDYC